MSRVPPEFVDAMADLLLAEAEAAPRGAAANDNGCEHPDLKTRGPRAWWCARCMRHICPEDRQKILERRKG